MSRPSQALYLTEAAFSVSPEFKPVEAAPVGELLRFPAPKGQPKPYASEAKPVETMMTRLKDIVDKSAACETRRRFRFGLSEPTKALL